MSQRRSHTKSRLGCDTCKARKVRCGQERPSCVRCAKGNRHCSYLDCPAGDEAAESCTGATTPPRGPPHAECALRLELLHHFLTQTCYTMSDQAALVEVWRNAVVVRAFRSPFLCDALLAVAALHRHRTETRDPSVRWLEEARRLQGRALGVYIPLLQSVDRDNCHALLACAITLGALSLAFLQEEEIFRASASHFLGAVFDAFDLLRGTGVIAGEAGSYIRMGDLGGLMDAEPGATPMEGSIDPGINGVLSTLLRKTQHAEQDLHAVDPCCGEGSQYSQSVNSLLALFAASTSGAITVHAIGAWPVHCGVEFTTLLRRFDSWALVILAHYGLLLHAHRRLWFFGGTGARIVETVDDLLGPEWSWYMYWAKDTKRALERE